MTRGISAGITISIVEKLNSLMPTIEIPKIVTIITYMR
jgi:hypothetical protein